MVSINKFLKVNENIRFIDKESGIEYTKDELDGDFQFYQNGSVTIQEYYDNLKEFLNNFRITSRLNSCDK